MPHEGSVLGAPETPLLYGYAAFCALALLGPWGLGSLGHLGRHESQLELLDNLSSMAQASIGVQVSDESNAEAADANPARAFRREGACQVRHLDRLGGGLHAQVAPWKAHGQAECGAAILCVFSWPAKENPQMNRYSFGV